MQACVQHDSCNQQLGGSFCAIQEYTAVWSAGVCSMRLHSYVTSIRYVLSNIMPGEAQRCSSW